MRIGIVGPVYPYRAGIAYCTTALARELAHEHHVQIHSYSRQFPKRFYPGGDDRDASLVSKTPHNARFEIDVVNPITWIREARMMARGRYDAVIFVWWVWIWAIPYLTMRAILPRSCRIILQCHNVGDKEPAPWKRWLTDLILRRADFLIVHARSEATELSKRIGERPPRAILFLPAHEVGELLLEREAAKRALNLEGPVALCFGHVRPYKGVDIALAAIAEVKSPLTLLVAGEVWWNEEERYRRLARELGILDRVRFEFRFIPDSEIAIYFSAADVVLAPYRREAQSGVVLTAFHFGRPVIATTVGGMPEIVRDGVNGLLVAPEDPRALAAAITRYFSSECNRRAMEREAAEDAGKYSWAEYGSRVAGLLRKDAL